MNLTGIDQNKGQGLSMDSERLASIAADMRKTRRLLETIRTAVVIIALIAVGVVALAFMGALGAFVG